MTKIIKVTWSL